MAFGRPRDTIVEVRDPRIKRYTLVPRSPAGTRPDGVKRFSLARVGSTPRSALAPADRLERMERIVDAERESESRNGGDPARKPAQRELGDQAAE